MGLRPEMAMIAKPPKRQIQWQLEAQSPGSKASKYGLDSQAAEKGKLSENWGRKVMGLKSEMTKIARLPKSAFFS